LQTLFKISKILNYAENSQLFRNAVPFEHVQDLEKNSDYVQRGVNAIKKLVKQWGREGEIKTRPKG